MNEGGMRTEMSVRIAISRSVSPRIREKKKVVKPPHSDIHSSLVWGEKTLPSRYVCDAHQKKGSRKPLLYEWMEDGNEV